MKKLFRRLISAALAASMCLATAATAYADEYVTRMTVVQERVYASGKYKNWDGVSNVAQFVNNKGQFCFAYDGDKYVTVVTATKEATVYKKKIQLEKKHPLFGTVICDALGNFYLVTGEDNKTNNTDVDTIFISKYDSNGKHIQTVGDNGSSSVADYYSSRFYTKSPFHAGNCDAAINGDILTVNYARTMYSGHQSNSVFTINTKTMTKLYIGEMYNSHSFAQRVLPYKNGFVYLSEGDCFPRAFNVNAVDINDDSITSSESDVFHFWVKEGTYDEYNMFVLNNNFAHTGGLAVVNDNTVALVGTSVKSLDSNANTEREQLFIQIFDPFADLEKSSSYVTSGTRSGVSGPNGTSPVTNYGVKWLTDFGTNDISNPQVVTTKDGKIVILYELYKDSWEYRGLYYIVLDSNGKRLKSSTLFSSEAHLNPCVMPVSTDDGIYWVSNTYNDPSNIYINILRLYD